MLVFHAYAHHEIQQMLDLLSWMLDLGGAKKHRCVMLSGCKVPKEDAQILAEMAGDIYCHVECLTPFYEDPRPWPVNCNIMWQRAAQYVFEKAKCPWFFQEPDCIPLKAGWLDAWEAEYKWCKKPFMGCVVDDPHHLTGNAIYPPDVRPYSPNLMLVDEHPWDVTDQPKILPHTHHSALYHHQWFFNVTQPKDATYSRAATHFDSLEQLDIISPNAVLFHRNKDGSLIRMLRQRKQSESAQLQPA